MLFRGNSAVNACRCVPPTPSRACRHPEKTFHVLSRNKCSSHVLDPITAGMYSRAYTCRCVPRVLYACRCVPRGLYTCCCVGPSPRVLYACCCVLYIYIRHRAHNDNRQLSEAAFCTSSDSCDIDGTPEIYNVYNILHIYIHIYVYIYIFIYLYIYISGIVHITTYISYRTPFCTSSDACSAVSALCIVQCPLMLANTFMFLSIVRIATYVLCT
jgi:hypothetical protein